MTFSFDRQMSRANKSIHFHTGYTFKLMRGPKEILSMWLEILLLSSFQRTQTNPFGDEFKPADNFTADLADILLFDPSEFQYHLLCFYITLLGRYSAVDYLLYQFLCSLFMCGNEWNSARLVPLIKSKFLVVHVLFVNDIVLLVCYCRWGRR